MGMCLCEINGVQTVLYGIDYRMKIAFLKNSESGIGQGFFWCLVSNFNFFLFINFANSWQGHRNSVKPITAGP